MFNDSGQQGRHSLPALTHAGIRPLFFVSIHPFEYENGRIGRAIAEKPLSQCLGYPTLIALAQTISTHRKAYYKALEANNRNLAITDWLRYFANTVLEAQRYTQRLIDFLIEKTRMHDRLRCQLNSRQDKVIAGCLPLHWKDLKAG